MEYAPGWCLILLLHDSPPLSCMEYAPGWCLILLLHDSPPLSCMEYACVGALYYVRTLHKAASVYCVLYKAIQHSCLIAGKYTLSISMVSQEGCPAWHIKTISSQTGQVVLVDDSLCRLKEHLSHWKQPARHKQSDTCHTKTTFGISRQKGPGTCYTKLNWLVIKIKGTWNLLY